jgi:hypothetical protein
MAKEQLELPIDLTDQNEYECCPLESHERIKGPRVDFRWEKPYHFPDEGILTVRFKTVRQTRDVEDGEYREVIALTEITGIEVVEEGPARSMSANEAGDALDKLRAEQQKGE